MTWMFRRWFEAVPRQNQARWQVRRILLPGCTAWGTVWSGASVYVYGGSWLGIYWVGWMRTRTSGRRIFLNRRGWTLYWNTSEFGLLLDWYRTASPQDAPYWTLHLFGFDLEWQPYALEGDARPCL
jgi:hypothetical protein